MTGIVVIQITLKVVDDKTDENNLKKIKNLINKSDLNVDFIKVDHEKYRKIIKKQKNHET